MAKATPLKLITGKDNLTKEISLIAVSGRKFERRVHACAVSTLLHANEHGDVTLINRLISLLPKGVRANAVRAWAEAFGGVRYDKETKELRKNKKGKLNKDKLMEVSPFEFKAEAEYRNWDMEEHFARFMITAARRVTDNVKKEEAENNIDMEAFDTFYGFLSDKNKEKVAKALEGSNIDMSKRIASTSAAVAH